MVYFLASLQLPQKNYQAMFAKCNFLTWETVTPFLSAMPENNRKELGWIIGERQIVIDSSTHSHFQHSCKDCSQGCDLEIRFLGLLQYSRLQNIM